MPGILITLAAGLAAWIVDKPFGTTGLNKKEKITFYIVWGCSMAAGILHSLHVNLPNPTRLLTWIYSGLY